MTSPAVDAPGSAPWRTDVSGLHPAPLDGGRAVGAAKSDAGKAVQADLDRVEQKVDALCEAVGELRALVVAGASSSNGNERKASAKAR